MKKQKKEYELKFEIVLQTKLKSKIRAIASTAATAVMAATAITAAKVARAPWLQN